MSKMTQVVQQLDRDNIEIRITPVLITVDPKRDSVVRLNEFLQHFDGRFIGMTGAPEALASATKNFNAIFTKKDPSMDDNYEITHSSVIYVVDPFS
jgi:protein SCO1/2